MAENHPFPVALGPVFRCDLLTALNPVPVALGPVLGCDLPLRGMAPVFA